VAKVFDGGEFDKLMVKKKKYDADFSNRETIA